jgi:nucleoside-diphosphate-sugar epimerase
MKELLKKHNVETVISALALFTKEGAESQMNLIQAAIDAGIVKRFIPSEYGINYSQPGLLEWSPSAKWWLDAANLLRSSHIDFTRVILGWYSDYFDMPHYKSNMKPFYYALDFQNRKAVLPGDGEAPVTFMHSTDVAKYIAAMLDEQKKWPELSPFATDKLTWNKVVEIAERVTGESSLVSTLWRLRMMLTLSTTGMKWEVTYDPIEKLEKGQATVLEQPEGSYEFPSDVIRALVVEFSVMAVRAVMDVTVEGLRNDEFPEIHPITVEELIQMAWGSK